MCNTDKYSITNNLCIGDTPDDVFGQRLIKLFIKVNKHEDKDRKIKSLSKIHEREKIINQSKIDLPNPGINNNYKLFI